jgi:hypothetical protein
MIKMVKYIYICGLISGWILEGRLSIHLAYQPSANNFFNKSEPTISQGSEKPVGTGPVRPIPGGTGPVLYMNRSGSHPKVCLIFLTLGEPAGSTGLPVSFFNRGNRPSHGLGNPAISYQLSSTIFHI